MSSAKLLQNVDLLLGESFELVRGTDLLIESGKILGIGSSYDEVRSDITRFDCKNMLAIPGFINAHTHIGDTVAKDLKVGSTLEELVHPITGAKTRILKKTSNNKLIQGMVATIGDMIACGTTTFVDFREGGLIGVELLRKALGNNPEIRAIVLGRPVIDVDPNREDAKNNIGNGLQNHVIEEFHQTLESCDGLGVSGPNEFTSTSLKQISRIAKSKKKLIGAHAAESSTSVRFSREHFAESEVDRAIHLLKPDFLVHLTNASSDDLNMVIKERIPIVCCPRANAILGLGVPPLSYLVTRGSLVALGTDNIMLNSPDIFREMDYTSKMIRALEENPSGIDNLEILKMVTINPSKILGVEDRVGSIEEGKDADLTILDMTKPNVVNTMDVISAIVHRVRQDNVVFVFHDGNVVKGNMERN
ncbi:MAG: amidohydrolase family protein [Nitrososphaerales archaeon]